MYYQQLEILKTSGQIDIIDLKTTEPDDHTRATDRITTAKIFKNKKGINAKYVGSIKGRRQVVIKILTNLLNKESSNIKTIYQH